MNPTAILSVLLIGLTTTLANPVPAAEPVPVTAEDPTAECFGSGCESMCPTVFSRTPADLLEQGGSYPWA